MLDAPSNDEIEISLFGPVRGYGESIALHIGGGHWIIVDSCRSSTDDRPAALAYLESIDVDVSKAVRLVVASHWHGDHIDGLGTIFEQCKEAKFVCSIALNSDELLEIHQSYKKHPPSMNKHGLEDLGQIISTLRTRSPAPRYGHLKSPAWAMNHVTLLPPPKLKDINCTITALSPSDASILKAQKELVALKEEFTNGPKRNTVPRNPNHSAVVLWVTVGKHNILLGSDLEDTKDPETGWKVILDEFDPNQAKADVYKVTHHGSISGDHPGIWETLLSIKPQSLLTPFFNGGIKLPKPDDVARIKKQTNHCYSTSDAPIRHRKFSRETKTLVHSATSRFLSIDNTIGQIRLRSKISSNPDPTSWTAVLNKNAVRL